MKMSELVKEARDLALKVRDDKIAVEKANAEARARREATRLLALQYTIARGQGRITNGSVDLPDVEIWE